MGDSMRYAKIDELEYVNGNGMGVSLYTQGCPFHCDECFNQIAWDFNGGEIWDEEVKNYFIECVQNPHVKRISILGGEPLASNNLDDVFDLIYTLNKKCPDKEIWLYTGYVFEDIKKDFQNKNNLDEWEKILECDTRWACVINSDVLIDGRFEKDKKDLSLKFRGSSNQRIINIKKTLESAELTLWEHN